MGEVYQFSIVDAEVPIANRSDEVIVAKSLDDLAQSISLKHEVIIEPHKTIALPIEIKIGHRLGVIHIDGKLKTDPPVENVVVGVSGFAMSLLDEARPTIDFGVINAGVEATQTLRPISSEVSIVRFGRILDVGEGFDAKVLEDGSVLSVTAKPNLGWGSHLDYVKVALTSHEQNEVWIRLKAIVHGNVVPSLDPLDFTVVRQGSQAEGVVTLRATTEENLQVDSVNLQGLKAATTVTPCPTDSNHCVNVKFVLDDAQPMGQFFGIAQVKFKGKTNALPIHVNGLVLAKDQKVIDLTENLEASSEKKSKAEPKSNLKSQLQTAIAQAQAPKAAPPGNGPLLKWTVGNELGIFGYGVYRAPTEAGPYERINSSLIRASNEGNSTSADYQWRDNSAESKQSYWYYIGIVYNDGHKQKLSSPQKVTAK